MFRQQKIWVNQKWSNMASKTVRLAVTSIITACVLSSTIMSAYANDNSLGSAKISQEKMLRIAEVLGSLHFLRNLCGEKSQIWREQMDELLAKDNPTETERLRLISNFNRGYRSYNNSYTHCTPSALAAIDSYLKEGAALAKELVSRYGN